MKNAAFFAIIALLPTLALAQAVPPGHPKMETSGKPAAPGSMPPGHPPIEQQNKPVSAAQLPHKGKVVSSIDVPNYTYIEVTENNKTSWLAATTVGVKKGDVIRFEDGMVMNNFHSKILNRTFPSISFINSVVVTKEKE